MIKLFIIFLIPSAVLFAVARCRICEVILFLDGLYSVPKCMLKCEIDWGYQVI
jgi:hypothetical protein